MHPKNGKSKVRKGWSLIVSFLLILGAMLFVPGYRTEAVDNNTLNYLAAGGQFGLACKSDGTVWTWGLTPVQVQGLSGVTAVAAGAYHSLALKSDGTVWTWGENPYGQLGDGTTVTRYTPEKVEGLNEVVAVAGGANHSLVLKSDGTVWTWGYNYNGELGDGTTTSRLAPVRVENLDGVTAISLTLSHNLALKSDGTLWAWGYNGGGQLGDGTDISRSTPVQVQQLSGIVAMAAGGIHSLALKSDGTVWAWGYNYYGQLGDGTTTSTSIPIPVQSLSGVTALAGGHIHSLALKTDGSVRAWGYNLNGELGDGTNVQSNSPVKVEGLSGITFLSTGPRCSFALASDGSVWAWGNNDGQLGDGTITDRHTPVQVHGPGDVGYLNLGTIGSYIPVTGISLNPPSITYYNGRDPMTITATVSPSNATYKNIIWTSSNNSVATVTNGRVTPQSPGTATITARAVYGSAAAQCIVTVNRIDYSVPENQDKDVIRKAALATLTDNDQSDDPKWVGLNVRNVLGQVPIFNQDMFTVSGKTVGWNDLYLNPDPLVNIGGYKILDSSKSLANYSTSMDAVAYQDINGDIIIAYAGTSDAGFYADARQASFLMLHKGKITQQFKDALDFYGKILKKHNNDNNNNKRVSLIGHSLGGALAAYVSTMEGGVKADCFNDGTGHMILHAYGDNPQDIESFSGADVTGYTSYINTDVDTNKPWWSSQTLGFNNWVTQFIDRRNHYQYGSNDYNHTDEFWYHNLASILGYDNGSFFLYYKRPPYYTQIAATEVAEPGFGLTLGTSGDDTLNTAGNVGTQTVYSGNGNDKVYGRSILGDTIIASGTGTKHLYGKGGGDTYIIDISQINSKITIDDPSGWSDKVLIKNSTDQGFNVNQLSIQEDTTYYYINFGNNRSVYVKKNRDWTQPSIKLADMNGNIRDFKTGPSIQSEEIHILDAGQNGYTVKSLHLTGQVDVKVYDQQGVLLGEHDNLTNDVQTTDYGYFYPVNTSDAEYLDIDLINGNYILKVTSQGKVDLNVDDPDLGGIIAYKKTGIDLADGSILIVNTDFLTAVNKFALEKDQVVTPISASEHVAAQQVNIDISQIDIKAGVSATVNATVSPANVVTGKVTWTVIQPSENIVVAGVATNEDGSATVTGITAGSATLRATAQDGSEIYREIPITVTQDGAPEYSAVDADNTPYTSGDWTNSSQVTLTVDPPQGYDEIYISDGITSTMAESLNITESGQHRLAFCARNSSTGEITITGTAEVNIDAGAPVIDGVSQDGEYYIDPLVLVADDGIDVAAINNNAFTEDDLVFGKWVTEPGEYTVTGADKLGLVTQVNFRLMPIPEASAVTLNDLGTIRTIRDEFELRKYDLPAERRDVLEQEISADEAALVILLEANAPSDDASLTNLVPSSGALNPAFAAGTTEYILNLPTSIQGITLVPTVNESHATVSVNGIPVGSGTASGAIILTPNIPKSIPVVVTAQDEITTKSYTVNITWSSTNTEAITSFVTRFYQLCLLREPDAGGLTYWKDQLKTGQQSGADIAVGFILSPEFIARGLTDSAFLDVMYGTFFDRAADTGGKDYWLSQMSGGMSRTLVLANFVGSQEFTGVCTQYGITKGSIDPNVTAFVIRFFQLCLERDPEPAGLLYWTNQLLSGQKTGADIAVGFVFSPELTAKNLNNTDFITIMYRVFFDRDPDSGGQTYWVGQLDAGTSRLQVLAGFVASPEFATLCNSIGIPVGVVNY